jgi:hypothetical protein
MKADKISGFVLNHGMAWATPEFEREKVNKSGEILVSPNPDYFALDAALRVVNNWRAIHACAKAMARN